MSFRTLARSFCALALLSAGMTVQAASERSALPMAQRAALLAAQVQAGEDVQAVKRLQRTYGYYVDKGLWADAAELFSHDAYANYPAGVFIGKASIREHLFRNVGNVPSGQLGLGDNRLYNHMNIQPVVHLDPGGQSAKGRWRVLANIGGVGTGATWAEGVYEMNYVRRDGVWKIARLDYHTGFSAPYAGGWVVPPATATRARQPLAHPSDAERKMNCEGFPAACLVPFHYDNPGATLSGGQAWDQSQLPLLPVAADLPQVTAELLRRAQRLRDEQDIENLQRIYGYYLDRAQWDQVADLFANKATLEFAQQGVYVGKARIRAFLGTLGPHGLVPGWLNDHLQLQTVVTVAPDGKTARARSRQWSMTGTFAKGGQWSEGIYENAYVNEAGVWKFQSVHYYPTFISDYDRGWAQDAQSAPGVLAELPPDRPPTQVYAIYPKAHVPPYHYRNPVTGAPATYPQVGGPGAAAAAAMLFKPATVKVKPVKDVAAAVTQAESLVARAKDFHELENLESAYGYYLDKNLWTDLANLFASEGSIELAQRGVYKGARLRDFLVKVFGRGDEGPFVGRLGNHIQMQPVIHVSADGQSAKIRLRMLQQMNLGNRASLGASVYENEAIKENGVWRFSVVHTYNTWSANYEGGWAKGSSRGMPGISPEFPPDSPPTTPIAMFPVVYEIPYHYANPVSGRTQVPALPPLAAQMANYPIPPTFAVPAPRAQATNGMPESIAAALREIGPRIDGAKTLPLYAPLQPREPYAGVTVRRDAAYGPHERHRVNVFTGNEGRRDKPVLVFIHGGGFRGGAKSAPDSPFYDNIGVWAAGQGWVGITINYRLAPQFQYPAGIEDLTRLVDWLKANVADYGGDPQQIILWGHSAGGAHVGDYLAHTASPGVAGAVLMSGIYTLGNTVSVWKDYYGDDVSQYPARESLPLLARSPVPLLITHAELDPENFVSDAQALVRARAATGLPFQQLRASGHSHISESYSVGSGDETVTAPIIAFVRSLKAVR